MVNGQWDYSALSSRSRKANRTNLVRRIRIREQEGAEGNGRGRKSGIHTVIDKCFLREAEGRGRRRQARRESEEIQRARRSEQTKELDGNAVEKIGNFRKIKRIESNYVEPMTSAL